MKKLITSLFALILVLAGCGTDTESTKIESDELSGSIQVAIVPSYVEYMQEMAAGFTEETGVQVEVIGAEMFDVMDALPTQQGNSADVFLVPEVSNIVNQRLITPVETDISAYSQSAQDSVTTSGDVYALPMTVETTLFIYNKDLMSEVPETLSDLDPSEWVSRFTNFYGAAGAFYSEGGYIFGDNNNDPTDIGLNNDGSIAAGQFIQSLYNSGDETWDLMKDDSVAYDVMLDAFKSGKVSAVIDGAWSLQEYSNAGIDYGVAPIPSLTGTAPFTPMVSNKGLAINAYSDNIPAAQAFLDYINTTENVTKFTEMTKEVTPLTTVEYPEGSVSQAIQEAASVGIPQAGTPEYNEIWDPTAEALKQIANGADVKDALDAAVNDLQAAINNLK